MTSGSTQGRMLSNRDWRVVLQVIVKSRDNLRVSLLMFIYEMVSFVCFSFSYCLYLDQHIVIKLKYIAKIDVSTHLIVVNILYIYIILNEYRCQIVILELESVS